MIIVELENIGGLIGKHRFEFKEGLNEILAPNATGKTSLIRAIVAMYAPRTIPAEQLLNMDANEGYVKLIINGKEYVRGFKREDGKIVEVESKPVSDDDRIRYIILDPYLGEVARRIIVDTNPDITDYLTKVFRLDEYERKRKELRDKIEELSREKEYLEREVEDLRKKSEERNSLVKVREELVKKLRKLKEVEIERVRDIQRRINDLSRRLGSIEARIKDIKERLIPITRERIEEIRNEVDRLERIVKDFYMVHKEPEKEIESLRERIEEVDKLIRRYEGEKQRYIEERSPELSVIRKALKDKVRVCPICGKPIEEPPETFWSKRYKFAEESMERIVKDYEKRIRSTTEEMKKLWKELEDLQRKYNEIREIETVKIPRFKGELNRLEKAIANYEKELARAENERDSIIKQLEELKKTLTAEEQRIAEERAGLERRLGEIEQQIKDLEEEIARKSEAGERLTNVRYTLEKLRKQLDGVEKELYETLSRLGEEFAKIASEIIKELGFTWLRSIRPVKVREEKDPKTGVTKRIFSIRIVRRFPSGRENEQPLALLSTSERLAVALIAVLVGYRLKIYEEYKGIAPILADEALLAFDPERFERVIRELSKYGRYVVITRLVEPEKAPKLMVVHR